MTLEDQLLNEFAKTMNTKEEDVETTAVGTIISVTRASETQLYDICTVRLDGANVDTPARMGVDGKVNDRVTVRIRKHKATVTGNLTSPGYTNTDKIDGISDYVTNGYLELHYLDADFIDTHYLTADQIQTDYITANTIAATYATLENLRSTNAEITNIKAQYVKTTELDAAVINSSVINANFAKLDATNINTASIRNAFVDQILVETSLLSKSGTVFWINAINIDAEKITTGTLDAGNLNVVNLDCASLTVGQINGVQIANNAVNMNKLTTELADYVTDASETAHSRNRVYHQPTAPQDADLIPGDTWFDTSNGYKMYKCVESGSLTDENGNVLTDENGNPLTAVRWEEERYSTSAIAAKAIVAEHLTAGCITSDKILARTIVAENIEVGTITATEIAVGSITADRINVTDLFAQDITATGTIRGVELIGATGTFSGDLSAARGTFKGDIAIDLADGVTHVNIGNSFEYPITITKDGEWTQFHVKSNGEVLVGFIPRVDIEPGRITMTSGQGVDSIIIQSVQDPVTGEAAKGIKILDHGTGEIVKTHLHEDGLRCYDSSGKLRAEHDQYGLFIYDASGNLKASFNSSGPHVY